jgi:type I restriction enzyme S subunit
MTETQLANKTNKSLPKGWRWVKLSDVCKQDRRIVEPNTAEAGALTYYSLEHIESMTGRILRAPNEEVEDEGKSTTFRFDERHVLYGKLRPYLNKVALPESKGRCTTEIIPLISTNDIDRGFLAWVLRRSQTVDFAMQGKTGSRMPRADMDNLLNLTIPLPPLNEQKHIEEILREQMASVEKARASAETRLETVKTLPAAFLRQVFPQPGQSLPTDWCWVKLGEVCQFIGGSQPSKGNFKYEPISGYVRLVQIQDFRLSGVAVFIPKEMAARCFDTSDVMIGRYGPPVFQILRGLSGAYNVALMKAVPFECLDRNFLYYLLQWPTIQRDVVGQSQRSAGQSGVQKEYLERYPVPLPPINEQRTIAKTIDDQMRAAEKARTAAEEELKIINAIPAALLRRAFSGEI